MKFKGHTDIEALINSGNKVNTMTSAYAAVLRLLVCPTNVKAKRIDRSTLLTHGIMLANFKLEDK